MDPTNPSAMLHRRLNSYGPAQPRALVSRRPTAAPELDALPLPAGMLQAPALRKRANPDAALSTGSLHDAASAAGSPLRSRSKAALTAGAEVLNASSPMLYSRMSRAQPAAPKTVAQVVDIGDSVAPAASAPAPAATSRDAGRDAAAADGGEKRDPFWFIRMLRTELSDHEFAYMNVADSEGTTWDPYNLNIVAFNEVNPHNHYTISEAGVTHCLRRGKAEESEFTPLAQWEQECKQFHEVMEIPFFKRYQSWKAYTSWRRAIQSDKIASCSQARAPPHSRVPHAAATTRLPSLPYPLVPRAGLRVPRASWLGRPSPSSARRPRPPPAPPRLPPPARHRDRLAPAPPRPPPPPPHRRLPTAARLRPTLARVRRCSPTTCSS